MVFLLSLVQGKYVNYLTFEFKKTRDRIFDEEQNIMTKSSKNSGIQWDVVSPNTERLQLTLQMKINRGSFKPYLII